MMQFVLVVLLGVASGAHNDNSLRANALITRMVSASGANVPHTAQVKLLLRDFSHPKHAGDAWEGRLTATLVANPHPLKLNVELRDEAEPQPDRFELRDEKLFRWSDNAWSPIDAEGELLPSTFMKFDPLHFVATIAAHRENAQLLDRSTLLVALHGEMLRVHVDPKSALITSVEKAISHPLFGDLLEVTTYDDWKDRGAFRYPSRITITDGGRARAAIDVQSVREDAAPATTFRELAPHLFAVDYTELNTRVFVAEFSDFVFVIEGANNSRNGDRLVRAIREQFRKPVRYHSFSHIHGQYVGSVRSYVAEGATIVTTPTGAEYVRQIASSTHRYDADALTATPHALSIEEVKASRRIEDETNSITIFNVESQHTDDYNIFYFPRSKSVLSGDLLCVRGADQPLKARSKLFVTNVEKLGLAVERAFITWPLDKPCVVDVPWADAIRANSR